MLNFLASYFAVLFVLAVFLGALYCFAKEIMRPDLVAILVMALLMIAGVVSIEEGVAGFSNPAVITVVMMFLLSSGLVHTGVADAMSRFLSWMGRGNVLLLTLAVMLTVSAMSAFMNNIAATIILLPSVLAAAHRAKVAPTKLLIPLSFGSLLGGMMTLIGTPPNLLVNIALKQAELPAFKMFDFFYVGAGVWAISIVYFLVAGSRLLPRRYPSNVAELTEKYDITDYFCEIEIDENSPWAQKSIGQIDFPDKKLEPLRIVRGDVTLHLPSPVEVLRAGDTLTVEGAADALMRLKEVKGLRLQAEQKLSKAMFQGDEDIVLGEVVVPPRSPVVEQSLRVLQFRTRYGLVVLGFRRGAQMLKSALIDEPLRAGDVLLVQGTPSKLKALTKNQAFLVVGRLNHTFRRKEKAWAAIASMALVVSLNLLGLHISLAAILGVLAMLYFGCIRAGEMYESIDWKVIFLIAGMMPLGTAMHNTGIIPGLVGMLESSGIDPNPYVVLAVFYILTAALTQVMSNAATVVLVAPLAVDVAATLGISPYTAVMAVAVAASSAFMTPIGHQANVLVYSLGGYQFKDFLRVGLPLNVILFFFSLWWIPRIWPFR